MSNPVLVWLVEHQLITGVVWCTPNYQWTADASEACWFTRKQDAELFGWNLGADTHAVEHMMNCGSSPEPAAHPLSYSEAERIGYRMFEHGKTNNTVSAQCEMQALRIKLGWTGAGASYPPTKEPKHGA